jgi:AraC family transcriptional regulator
MMPQLKHGAHCLGKPMAVNIGKADVGGVEIRFKAEMSARLVARRVVQGHLILVEVRYGQSPVKANDVPPCGDAFTVSVRLTDEISSICINGKLFRTSSSAGDACIAYIPAVDYVDFASPRRSLEMLLHRSFLDELAEDLEAPRIVEIGRKTHIMCDPDLLRFANLVLPCLDMTWPIDPLWADQFMWSFGIYVSATYGGLETSRREVGGLSRWQESMAKEVIELTLVEGIHLTELASMCGLRTSQFAHAFKRSVGISPYQWLIQRRVDRAKQRLGEGLSLPEVASSCGFADQSHLIRLFRRIVGTTPRAWQKLAYRRHK